MKYYATIIRAICPVDGILKDFCGPKVPGISYATARQYCEENGLGYCSVEGVLWAEVDGEGNVTEFDTDGFNPN